MSIGSINDTSNTQYVENIQPRRENAQDTSTASALSQLTDQASLSALAPRLQNILKAIDHPDDNVMQALSSNISSLQDAFVDEIYTSLAAQGIDLSEKITLQLNAENQLTLAQEHADKEKIEAALAGKPELSEAFSEIASQSELLRDVSNIGKVIGERTGLQSYQSASNAASNNSYKISMKGEMSHFYFAR
ncbi:hypothetical protein LJC48_00030 [Desulfovibrio sp. OttesenSCG-928-C06]|nr:hypothetical protein [Desulfovibrio sp. OttesenSCG-928-C06]